MRSIKASARHFNVRSDRGAFAPAKASFSSGFMTRVGETAVPVSDDDVIAAALRVLSQRMTGRLALTNPRITREYLAIRFSGLEHEVFVCLFLDARNRIISCEESFRGTIDGAAVYPREIVKRALAHNASAVIVSHNHPSGVAEPSQADELLTQRLKAALDLVGVRLLDHLVVGGAVVESFAERGLL
jgi:DNA repair protein RadC